MAISTRFCGLLQSYALSRGASEDWYGAAPQFGLSLDLLSAYSVNGILTPHFGLSQEGGTLDPGSLALAIALVVVTLTNVATTVFQDYSSSAVMKSIRGMMSPNATVIRDGQTGAVPTQEIVPGDVIVLSLGDRVPADVRMISVSSLRVDQSILTGEAEPVSLRTKQTSDSFLESRNITFCGSSVVEGSGIGIVIATGNNTVMGSIAAKYEIQLHSSNDTKKPAKPTFFVSFFVTPDVATTTHVFSFLLCRSVRVSNITPFVFVSPIQSVSQQSQKDLSFQGDSPLDFDHWRPLLIHLYACPIFSHRFRLLKTTTKLNSSDFTHWSFWLTWPAFFFDLAHILLQLHLVSSPMLHGSEKHIRDSSLGVALWASALDSSSVASQSVCRSAFPSLSLLLPSAWPAPMCSSKISPLLRHSAPLT